MDQSEHDVPYTETDPDPVKSAELTKDQEITWETVGELFDILYEHDTATVKEFPGEFKSEARKDTPGFTGDANVEYDDEGREMHFFEYAEHRYLGDSMVLPDHAEGKAGVNSAFYNPLVLDNGLRLTYGEINGLAGDFFGATNPISSERDPVKRKEAFLKAWGYLAVSANGKKKAEGLQKALAAEVQKVNDAIKQGEGNSAEINQKVQEVYKKLPFDLKLFDGITKDNTAGPIYTELLKANLDHFGQFGRDAYNAGHACALEEAAKGGKDNLLRAYSMNAFCDHYLEDNFAAGHLRVPRDRTTSSGSSPLALMRNLSANVMHEEDGGSGLKVESPRGTKWTCYGDAKLFQPEEADWDKEQEIRTGKTVNLEQCRDALKQSIKEVYDAYTSKKVIPESQFGVWQIAPDLKKVDALNPGHRPLLYVKDNKLWYRNGGPDSTSGTCVDDRWAVTEAALWTKFYAQNSEFVAEKIKRLLGF